MKRAASRANMLTFCAIANLAHPGGALADEVPCLSRLVALHLGYVALPLHRHLFVRTQVRTSGSLQR